MNERGIKEAFDKVKIDISSLASELSSLRQEIDSLRLELQTNRQTNQQTNIPTHNPTDNPEIQVNTANPTDNPTVPHEIRGLKYQNLSLSMRNEGVPTDKQTNRQTNQQTDFLSQNSPPTASKSLSESFLKASEILSSLDSLKKEIRLQFKNITHQEMLVFSSIYQLEERFQEGVEYRQIAQKLGLSESSIRDYVQRIIFKGIPILKEKLNNKKILLKISPELKQTASLDTLIKLREL